MKRQLEATDNYSESPKKLVKPLPFTVSTWLNSAVLVNVYSFLPFREALSFRLVNHMMNQELRISSNSYHELFIMNRLGKVIERKENTLEYFHGCLMKVNGEIRNCMILGNDIDYFEHLFESGDENMVILKGNNQYCKLFQDGIVSFNAWLGAVFSQTQGGRSELKILKKSSGNQKEFMYFTQQYVYGPNTRIDNLERFYMLKVRESKSEEKCLVSYLNSYYTWEDEPTGTGCIHSNSIKEIMGKLEIPSKWDWKDFLKFLMISTGAYEYCCSDPIIIDGNKNVWKSMIKELKSTDGDLHINPTHTDEREGLNNFDEVIKPIVDSQWCYSQKLDYLNAIRDFVIKQCSSKTCNIYRFGHTSWDSFDTSVDEAMLQKIKSKLKYYTVHEACYLGFTEYIQEEMLLANVVFELADSTLSTLSFRYDMLYNFTEPSSSVSLKQDDEEITLHDLVDNILGIDLEQEDEKVLDKFAKCLLMIFGQCHRVQITESREKTTSSNYFQNAVKESVEMLMELA